MKRKFRRMTAAMLLVLFSTLLVSPAVAGEEGAARSPIKVICDGAELACDQPPIIQNGRVLVPLRAIFEALGATVDWNGTNRTITSQRGDISLSMVVDDNRMIRNGETIYLDVPPRIANNRALVPVRAVSQSFNASVEWDSRTQTVSIKNDGSGQPPQSDPREKDYQRAVELLNEGYSYNAYYAFDKLGNYLDSSQKKQEAKLLNFISYNYNANTSHWFNDNAYRFQKLDNAEIRALMPSAEWYVPSPQALGYETFRFNSTGSATRQFLDGPRTSFNWTVQNNGLVLYAPNPNTVAQDFRKLANGAYVNILVTPYFTEAMIFMDTNSNFGRAYHAVAERQLDYSDYNIYPRIINDGNVYYMAQVDWAGNIIQTLPS